VDGGFIPWKSRGSFTKWHGWRGILRFWPMDQRCLPHIKLAPYANRYVTLALGSEIYGLRPTWHPKPLDSQSTTGSHCREEVCSCANQGRSTRDRRPLALPHPHYRPRRCRPDCGGEVRRPYPCAPLVHRASNRGGLHNEERKANSVMSNLPQPRQGCGLAAVMEDAVAASSLRRGIGSALLAHPGSILLNPSH
jgi:hypothetical protein